MLQLDKLYARIQRNTQAFGDQFPTVGQGATYELAPNDNWLAAFWPGLLWLTVVATQDADLQAYASARLPSFAERLDRQVHITHDLGFLYTLSTRAQWQITGDEAARQLALRAADMLAARYRPAGRYIQAWGAVGDPDEGGRIIIDTMMNVHLLFWASAETGDPRYAEIARNHCDVSAQHLVRDDGSTNHTFFFDQETGAPIGPRTHQGYADNSLWARGQSWAIFGFATAAEWTGDTRYAEIAQRAAVRFISELPPDGVPTWDLRLPPGETPHPDTSAGAIAAAGMLRLARTEPALRQTAELVLGHLISGYVETRAEAQGLLRGGTYHAHKNWGVNEYFICGDYFFLEALHMLQGICPDFWGPTNR